MGCSRARGLAGLACALVLLGMVLISAGALCAAPGPGLPCQSSPIALTPDGGRLINVNPEANSISLFNVAGNGLNKVAEIGVGVGMEPSSVTVTPNSRRAFVANALTGTVSVVDLLTRTVRATLRAGAEPMALALSPNGRVLYVANSASNDLDERVFVALFYGQLRPGKGSVDEGQDDQRKGRVLVLNADGSGPAGIVPLGPIANAGFNANGRLAPANGLTPAVPSTNPQTLTTPTGVFPNQLSAVSIRPGQPLAYVPSTGASPNGPLRFNQMAQGLVSVFNIDTGAEVTAAQTDPAVRRTAPLNINQGVNLATTPTPRIFQTNPVALAWRPDGSDAWIAVQSSNLLVRMNVDGGGIPSIGAPLLAGPSQADPAQRADLIAFLRSIDQTTPIFP